VTGGHSHELSFYSVFEGWKDVVVDVNPHPKAYPGDIRKSTDVLVLYDMVDDLPDDQKARLREFAEAGKGIVALHHSICSFPQTWEWYWKELIGGSYRPESNYKHDQKLMVTAAIQHPIVEGVAPLELVDETYGKLWIAPRSRILLRTDHPGSDGPVAWISPYRKSRVVYIQLGHGREAHTHPAYRRLVHQAIQWAAERV
jgi:type 1 glutamine amidotransferase